jgi:hypothetical protein
MNFNFNMDRIRGGGGWGQRGKSPLAVICITRGIGGLNGVSRERQPFRDIPSERVGHDNLLVAGQANKFPRPGPEWFGFSVSAWTSAGSYGGLHVTGEAAKVT